MGARETKHFKAFCENKLQNGETVASHLEGWTGEMMGKGDKTQRNGHFILTSKRACFYRKGILGEIFEAIPLAKITSVEVFTFMGYRVLCLHTDHDELKFKSLASKEAFDDLYEQLESLRNVAGEYQPAPAVKSESVTDQIRELGKLLTDGILTNDEFSQKKAELLQKM